MVIFVAYRYLFSCRLQYLLVYPFISTPILNNEALPSSNEIAEDGSVLKEMYPTSGAEENTNTTSQNISSPNEAEERNRKDPLLFSNEAIREILFSILLSISLPFGDTGTDLRLGYRLYVHGHPRWALCVLSPVVINTIFTVVSCRLIEKKKEYKCWWLYLPLVLLQIYPQFCICRLIYRYVRRRINLSEFVSSRDSLDGGLGCLEPYIESVPQVYTQTAIFAFVHTLDPLLTKLCFTEKNRSCSEFDDCRELFDCNLIYKTGYSVCDGLGTNSYIAGYGIYYEILSCRGSVQAQLANVTANCTERFEECITPFRNCFGVCKENLTDHIMKFDDDVLYEIGIRNKFYTNNSLIENYNATETDLKFIQMYLLVVGNYDLFVSAYVVSILSASYGVTKYFRLGHARFATRLSSSGFIRGSLLSTSYMVLKGVVLGGIVFQSKDPLSENVMWWILLTMLPTTVLFVYYSLYRPLRKQHLITGTIPWQLAGRILVMFMKQPSAFLASHVTPFFFAIKDIHISDRNPAKRINEKNMKTVSCYGFFEYDEKKSFINTLCCFCGASILISWKSSWIDGVLEICCAFMISYFVWFFGAMFWHDRHNEVVEDCMDHKRKECLPCIQFHGFYIKKYKYFESCHQHENKKPFESSTPTNRCIKCMDINIRYCWQTYSVKIASYDNSIGMKIH